MTVDELTQRVSELYQRIDELQQQYLSDPESSSKVLADAMEELQISLEELAAAEKNRRLLTAVQEERDKLSALVNSISDEVWFADTQKKFTLANPSALREFGLASGEVDVEKLAASLEVYRPDGSPRPSDEAPPLLALQGEAVRSQEEIIRTPATGELRYRQVSSSPVKDAKGNIIGSVSVVRDITDRKRMEGALQEKQEELEVQAEELEAQNEELRINNDDLAETTRMLQESEARFRATFEQAAVGIEMLNLDGRFLRGNAMLSDILGYSQKELQYLNFADITYPDDLVRELPLLEDLLARRIGHYTIEKRYLRKDGQGVWVRVTSSLANVKEPYRISIIEDITERKRAEEALQEAKDQLEIRVKERTLELEQANARLQEEIAERKKAEEALHAAGAYNRSLIEASLDPLVTIGPEGKITDVNTATEAVTGYSRGEIISTDFSDYFTEPKKAREGYQKVFAEGFVTDYPLTIRHKDGRLTDVLYNASIYKDIRGQVLGVFAAARDVTERRRAENELDKYRMHLEEIN
ncbi:MAG: PAS domain S-box protein, partial [Methanotrichaceae archaeon]